VELVAAEAGPPPAAHPRPAPSERASDKLCSQGGTGDRPGATLKSPPNRDYAALRDDLAPAWLAEPLTIEDTAERYIRPALQQTFVDLCRGSVTAYLDRFGFASELLQAMYVVTDALIGACAGPDSPGTGHNFLCHNMCRLPGSGGTWMIVRGGMGTVTSMLADAARSAGATISTGARVDAVRLPPSRLGHRRCRAQRRRADPHRPRAAAPLTGRSRSATPS
jgi:phytoene dehydrogenase-like protein